VAKEDGRVLELLVIDHQHVNSGDSLIKILSKSGKNEIIFSLDSGEVLFADLVIMKKYFSKNDYLLSVQNNKKNFVGEMHLSTNEISDVRTGQKVLFRMGDQSTRMNSGYVEDIGNEMNTSGKFLIKVKITDQLFQKNQIREIKYGKSFEAKIITDEEILFQKIFKKSYNIVN